MGKAIRNDEVDIVFGESEEILQELFKVTGRDNLKMLIRNLYEDGAGEHWMSIKLVTNRKEKGFSHAGKAGIPIVFTKKKTDWKVFMGGSDDKVAKARDIQSRLIKSEIKFIEAVINELGDYILEYWELDPRIPAQHHRMLQIREEIEDKYVKS